MVALMFSMLFQYLQFTTTSDRHEGLTDVETLLDKSYVLHSLYV